MPRTASAGVLLAMLCTTAFLSGRAQGPTPLFRSGVDLVEVDAYVTDSKGNPVTGLTAEDFEVVEGGKRQTISYFSRVDIPIERTEERSSSLAFVDPDVRSNDTSEGRLYIIAVDELTPANGLRARVFLRRFVEQHFGANDLAAVVLISQGRRVDTQELTSNRRLLLRAIDRVSGWPNDGPELAPPVTLTRGIPTLRLYALRDLMQALERIPSRRKAMLLLTEDIGLNMTAVIDTPMSAAAGPGIQGDIARDVLRSAARGNVTIYPVDPHGLTLSDVVNGQRESGVSLEMDRVRRRLEVARRQNLHSLGEVTGGFALVSSNNYQEAFARIVRENSAYYMLGYYPTTEKADGKFRRRQVRVKRPGHQVHVNEGYFAPKERTTPPPLSGVSAVLSSPLAIQGLPIKVVAAPYRGEAKEAAIAAVVEIDGRALSFEPKGDAFTANLEIGYVLTSATVTSPTTRGQVNLVLRPDSYQKVRTGGLRVLLESKLPPGIHQLRVGVAQAGGRSGSVVYDVEVPDFSKEALVLSGVSLMSRLASASHLTSGENLLSKVLPGPMTTARQFTSDDTVAVYVEVYANMGDAAPHTVTVRTELRSVTGATVRSVTTERPSTALNRREDGFGFLSALPLTDISPGSYVVEVEAIADVRDRLMVGRSIPIQIQ